MLELSGQGQPVSLRAAERKGPAHGPNIEVISLPAMGFKPLTFRRQTGCSALGVGTYGVQPLSAGLRA